MQPNNVELSMVDKIGLRKERYCGFRLGKRFDERKRQNMERLNYTETMECMNDL